MTEDRITMTTQVQFLDENSLVMTYIFNQETRINQLTSKRH